MILVDTHVWVWWVTNARTLSAQQATAIREADEIGVSVMSVWEVCTKVSKGKMDLDAPLDLWLERAVQRSRLRLLPVDFEAARESTRLPGAFHRDPADQIIVATARVLGIPLVTSDAQIIAYPHVNSIG